ncbi:TAXI family TRAP transporter solute-binding subunit [Poseidonibacter lekithochrous]|uniref:TAXI family TRAP transporter solute-binding subunit n=1 Tax=Poseidonibacter TaxID=2321187 RepID=UPI001C084183|nr:MULTISPECIES: TAXI family TRAP transporter solute-binding subunit [Poseidonibacter]MBU3014097.1 TAXI family TRAP transporter solute-binding subunit [Poseidonibacter lekithochrous]MDO6827395.1 TAXI family TRAP transporter solute-binding subunit [Poseidonibacter sp. 1_MG-2023]
MKNKVLLVSLLILAFIIASFYTTIQFIQPVPKKEFTIATGSKNGQYYKTALIYKEILEKQKVKVNILTSKGSIDNLQLIKEKKADVAFIQNGIDYDQKETQVSTLASTYYEPLWIFYRNEKYTMDYIVELTSKKISVGQEGSGTNDLASKILSDNKIDNTNSSILNYSTEESKEKLLKGELDAIFLVSSPDSAVIKELLENPDINLFSLKRAKAYSRKYNFLEPIKLYEGTINLYKNVPSENINLLATTALLVARDDFSEELTRLVLKSIKDIHNKKNLFEAENQFPNLHNITIKTNEEAQRYFDYGDTWLEKIFPYWIASNLDRLKILIIPLITLLIPLIKGTLPLYKWSVRSKIYRWYDELQALDLALEGLKIEELKSKLLEVEELKKEIKEETKVPLSYMGEYYDLIMHLELIISKLHSKINNN